MSFLEKMKYAAMALAVSTFAHPAMAADFTVNANDDIYGSYSGNVSGTVNSPSSFSWYTAGFFWEGNIDLTHNGNVIADIITSGDLYTLYTGNSAIGKPSTASASIEVSNGQTVSLYNTISSLNGGLGVCCDFNGITPQITINSVGAPEIDGGKLPLALLLTGVVALIARRRRTLAAA